MFVNQLTVGNKLDTNTKMYSYHSNCQYVLIDTNNIDNSE